MTLRSLKGRVDAVERNAGGGQVLTFRTLYERRDGEVETISSFTWPPQPGQPERFDRQPDETEAVFLARAEGGRP